MEPISTQGKSKYTCPRPFAAGRRFHLLPATPPTNNRGRTYALGIPSAGRQRTGGLAEGLRSFVRRREPGPLRLRGGLHDSFGLIAASFTALALRQSAGPLSRSPRRRRATPASRLPRGSSAPGSPEDAGRSRVGARRHGYIAGS